MTTPSRLKRRRASLDLYELKDGERNAARSFTPFFSQGRRQMTAVEREREERRKKQARAALQRKEEEKARRAQEEIKARQKKMAASIAGKVIDLTCDADDVVGKSPPAAEESELVSDINDSDFESDVPLRSASISPPRDSKTAKGREMLITLEEDSSDESDAKRSLHSDKENAANRDTPSNETSEQSKSPVVASTEVIVLTASDDDEDPSPKRKRLVRQSEIKPKARKKQQPIRFGRINVPGNEIFSNPATKSTVTSSEILRKATGRVSGLKSRDGQARDKSRIPLREINKRGNRASRKSMKQSTVYQNLVESFKSSPSPVKRPPKPKLGVGEVLTRALAEQQRRRGVYRFSKSPVPKPPQRVDLELEDDHISDDTFETIGLRKSKKLSATPHHTSGSAAQSDRLDEAVSLSGRASSAKISRRVGDERNNNKRLIPLSTGERSLWKSLTIKVPKRKVMTKIVSANITLHGEDFNSLRGCRWLNDEIMNSFAALINERNRKFFAQHDAGSSCETSPGMEPRDIPRHNDYDTTALFQRERPRTHVFNSFFFTRLTTNGYDYNGVRRWPKRAGVNVDKMDLIMFPINLNNCHWVLAVIDLRAEQFIYCDSMYGHDTNDVLFTLRQWLADEVKHKSDGLPSSIKDVEQWPCLENPHYLPEQRDAGSCGIFALYTADYLEMGKKPDFNQKDIHILRQRTAIFLQTQKLPVD